MVESDYAKMSESELRKAIENESDRRKFHLYFRHVYLKDPIVADEPHHADRHGMLGYENNNAGYEIHTDKEGNPQAVEIVGFCKDCTKDRPSAKESFDKWMA
jgi:hypothetical protein